MRRDSRHFKRESENFIIYLRSSSLVLCLSAGPWQPTPPLFSILRPPLHTNIRSLHEVVNHPNPWSAPRSLILHSSFQHKLQQPITPHDISYPILLPSHDSINNSPAFNNSLQYFFITHFVFPTHFL